MVAFIVRRLAQAAPVLLIVTIIVDNFNREKFINIKNTENSCPTLSLDAVRHLQKNRIPPAFLDDINKAMNNKTKTIVTQYRL